MPFRTAKMADADVGKENIAQNDSESQFGFQPLLSTEGEAGDKE